MKVADLLAQVSEHGYRVALKPEGPVLTRELGDGTLPGQLLVSLKENREAVVRHLTAAAVLARAGEVSRPVWGLVPGEPLARRLPGAGVPGEWGWLCVEGDREWTVLPRESS